MYSSFRKKFLKNIHSPGLQLISIRHSLRGPDGEDLFTDYVYTPEKRKKVLVHLCGVHGVEGYIGSKIQTEILFRSNNLENLPFQMIFVHAVNPYGMAWFHRTNANNVDLNRNGLQDFNLSNQHYPAFKNLLTTAQAIPQAIELFKLLPLICRIGTHETVKAIASGQSQFPEAPFFTGHQVQSELLSLVAELKKMTSEDAELYFLDVHSGLGKFSDETLIFENNPENNALDFFETAFQESLFDPSREKNAYPAHGSLPKFLKQHWSSQKIFYILQEFGTRRIVSVLKALVKQNQFMVGKIKEKNQVANLKSVMLHNFYPQEEKWQKKCLQNGLLRFEQIKNNLNRLALNCPDTKIK